MKEGCIYLWQHEERLVGNVPFLPEIMGQNDPSLQKHRLPIDIRS